MKNRFLLVAGSLLACVTGVPAQTPSARLVPPLSESSTTDFAADRVEAASPNALRSGGETTGRFWARGDYLFWSMRGSALPPLVTAAPATSTATVPGALGNADTTTLFGNRRVNESVRSGFRLQGGYWLDDCRSCGLDASLFYLCPGTNSFGAASDGTTTSLFRPIFNTITGRPGVEDVTSLTDGIVGQVGVQTKSLFLGGDLNCRHQWCFEDECGRGYRLDWLAGYRALSLTESLRINENLTTLDLANNPNGTIAVEDRFRTRNLFQGVQVGLDGEYWCDRWFVGVRGLVAVGVNHQSVDIAGTTVTQALTGAPVIQTGGLLALPTNIGNHHRDEFAVSPTLGLKLGYQWSSCLRTAIGYDCTYLSNVVRPGDQIDLVVNPNQVPPPNGPPFVPARPAFAFHGSDFWAHGLTLSVEFRF